MARASALLPGPALQMIVSTPVWLPVVQPASTVPPAWSSADWNLFTPLPRSTSGRVTWMYWRAISFSQPRLTT